jgi:hypothetical protein
LALIQRLIDESRESIQGSTRLTSELKSGVVEYVDNVSLLNTSISYNRTIGVLIGCTLGLILNSRLSSRRLTAEPNK